MKTIEIKVKNCKNCPFSVADFQNNQYNCFAPIELNVIGNTLPNRKYNIKTHWKKYSKPKWCPLIGKELKISL